MSELKRTVLRNRKTAALTAIGTLVILAIAGMTALQQLADLSAAQKNASLSPTDPRHPRWDTAHRDPATAAHKIRKTEGMILSEVAALTELPGPDGGVFRLKGSAQTHADVSEMRYAWNLTENLRLRSGESQGLVTDLKAGDQRSFEVELEAVGPGPHRAIFRAWRMKGNDAVGNAAHFVLQAETPQLEAQGAHRVPTQTPKSPRSPEEMRRRAIQ